MPWGLTCAFDGKQDRQIVEYHFIPEELIRKLFGGNDVNVGNFFDLLKKKKIIEEFWTEGEKWRERVDGDTFSVGNFVLKIFAHEVQCLEIARCPML